jgi:hypothetical protein
MPQPRAVPRAAMALAALSGDEHGNPFGDEGLTALLAPPPPPAGALSPPTRTGVLTKLKGGAPPRLQNTQITDAGCATLAAALDSGALPVLEDLHIPGTRRLPVPRQNSPSRRHWSAPPRGPPCPPERPTAPLVMVGCTATSPLVYWAMLTKGGHIEALVGLVRGLVRGFRGGRG